MTPALKKRNFVNTDQIHNNPNSKNLLSNNRDIPGYNYKKCSQPNINLNFNININCHNENNIVNANKGGIDIIDVQENSESEEKLSDSEYESVMKSVYNENYMGNLSRVNSKFEKVYNFQSHYNDNKLDRNSSLFTISELNLSLPNIKFDLENHLDLNFFKKNLKVFNVKVRIIFILYFRNTQRIKNSNI